MFDFNPQPSPSVADPAPQPAQPQPSQPPPTQALTPQPGQALTPQPGQAPTPQPGQAPTRSQPQKIAPNVEMTDLNDDSVKKYDFEFYGGKQNQIDRIFIPVPGSITKVRSHYVERGNFKVTILCRSEFTRSADGKQETVSREASCCKLFGPSQQRFGVPVVQYGTTPQGQIITQPFSVQYKLWRFGAEKYLNLRAINQMFPLDRSDLIIHCTEENYQRLTINAAPDGCIVRHPNFPQAERQRLAEWLKSNLPRIHTQMGKTFDNEQAFLIFCQQNGLMAGAPGQMPTGVQMPPPPAMVPQSDAPVTNFDDVINVNQPPQR